MDEAVIGNLVIISLILISFVWNYLKSQEVSLAREELNDRLEVLDQGMSLIGVFLEKIPEMQPNFQINQNPLSQILDMIMTARTKQEDILNRVEAGEHILADGPVRDVQGRFSNGEEGQQQEIEL